MVIDEISDYSQLKQILEESDWQSFEKIVGKIFEFHNYDVRNGVVLSFENTKRQYDVIAEKENAIFADCKKWDNKRRIKYGLKRAVEDQIERVGRTKFSKEKYPIIVTSKNSPIKRYKQVPIISVHKLSDFLSNFQMFNQKILKIP